MNDRRLATTNPGGGVLTTRSTTQSELEVTLLPQDSKSIGDLSNAIIERHPRSAMNVERPHLTLNRSPTPTSEADDSHRYCHRVNRRGCA